MNEFSTSDFEDTDPGGSTVGWPSNLNVDDSPINPATDPNTNPNDGTTDSPYAPGSVFKNQTPIDYSFLSNLNLKDVSDYLKGNRGLASLLGGAGVAALGMGDPTTKSSIYQGGIPNLVATRNMITAPPVGRRAGAGGVNYGGDVTYSLAPEGQKPYATTRGDSAFITDPQGQANILKGTGGTDAQSMANKISYNLPGGWENYTPDKKIAWFNQNNVSIDQLRAAGVPQSDIDYMWSNGYTSGRPADWGKTKTTTAGADTVTSGAGADTITGGGSKNTVNTTTSNAGVKIGNATTPADWGTYDSTKKINWFNTNSITPAQLLAYGVPQSDIDYMWTNGYTVGRPANWGKTNTVTTGTNTVTSGADTITAGTGADTITSGSGLDALNTNLANSTRGKKIGLTTLPGNWDTFDAKKKIAWYNTHDIGPSELLAAGVNQSDIDYMYQNGYKIGTATAPVDGSGVQAGAVKTPVGWNSFTPAQKIKWYNDNNITVDNLLKAGANQSDIDYMKTKGYNVGANTGGSGIDALANAQKTAQTQADAIGLKLPSDWSTYDQAKKIAWFNQQGTTAKQLLDAGVSQGDIDYMQQRGLAIESTKPDLGNTTGDGGITTNNATNVNTSSTQKKGIPSEAEWSSYTPGQKIDFFNRTNTSTSDLRAKGVDEDTINWMIQNGLKPQVSTPEVSPTTPSQSAGLMSAIDQGMSQDKYISNIKDFLNKNNTASDAEIYKQMQEYGIGAEDVASALGVPVSTIQGKIQALQIPSDYNPPEVESRSSGLQSALDQGMDKGQYIGNIKGWLTKNSSASDAEVFKQMQEYGVGAEDVAAALGVPVSTIENKIKALQSPEPIAPSPDSEQYRLSNQSSGMQSALKQGMSEDQYIGNIKGWLTQNATASDAEVFKQMQDYGIGADDLARALGVPVSVIQSKINALGGNNYASGGMAEGRYLQGGTDGMADEIPAQIGEDQPAALSHGEFVIPADVVSHMGNGNSDAGAKKLYQMMDRIRMARTGNKEQGKKINPDSFMPGGLAQAYTGGGSVMNFATGGTTTLPANVTGTQAGLSNWSGDYTTDLMGQGRALANMPFQQYMGPLTAGPSALQNKVSQGLEGINFPGILGQSFASSAPTGMPTMPADMGTYAPQQKADLYNQFRGQGYGDQAIRQASGTQTDTDWQNLQDMAAKSGPVNIPQQQGLAGSYMNPYLQNVLQPQLAELNRQSQINLQPSLAKLTQAGGFGGGRQAIMESESNRNLLNAQNTAIGSGYANAYDKAMQQFNTEQGQAKTLADMMAGQGAVNRGIESEGVAADKAQFEEARANPYKMVQFQQSLLQGMPINAMDYTIQDPSTLTKVAQGVNTVDEMLKVLYGITPAKKI